jgi:hypothetical protein
MADPTEVTINDKVRELVAEASGIDINNVIPGNDSDPSPNNLYATVLEITTISEGIDSEVQRNSVTPNKVEMHSKGNRIGVFSVQFFRDGAADAIRNLAAWPSTSVAQIWLNENGITWKRLGDIRNIDAVIATKYEQRRSVDIEIRYTSLRIDTINQLDSVVIDVETTSDSGEDLSDSLEVII